MTINFLKLKKNTLKKNLLLLFSFIILTFSVQNVFSKSLKCEYSSKHHHSCSRSPSQEFEIESAINSKDELFSNSIDKTEKDSFTNKKDDILLNPMNNQNCFVSLKTKKSTQAESSESPKFCCKPNPQISLTGSAKTSIKTDQIRVGIQIDTKRPNAQQALQINTQTSNTVTSALITNGVVNTDITTVNFPLQPQYISVSDPNNKDNTIEKFDGYLVSNFIDVKTNKINLAGKIIDVAVENGAKLINYVNFEILPETLEQAKKLLIKAAVDNGLERANRILDPLNLQVKEISSISLSEMSPIYRRAGEEDMVSSVKTSGSSAPVIFNNEMQISANVYMVLLTETKNEINSKDVAN